MDHTITRSLHLGLQAPFLSQDVILALCQQRIPESAATANYQHLFAILQRAVAVCVHNSASFSRARATTTRLQSAWHAWQAAAREYITQVRDLEAALRRPSTLRTENLNVYGERFQALTEGSRRNDARRAALESARRKRQEALADIAQEVGFSARSCACTLHIAFHARFVLTMLM
jgi:hypothetical protein